MFSHQTMRIKEQDIPKLILEKRDEKVVSLLYKKVFPKVKGYIVSRGGTEDDAYDAFQDGIMYLYQQIISDKYDLIKYSVYGYLYRLSINRWFNRLKKNKPLVFTDEIEEDLHVEPEKMSQHIDFVNDNENALKRLFSGIGEKCLELLELTIYSDLMHEDIVDRLNFASLGAVKMQVKRCKEKLKKEAEQYPDLVDRLIHD